MAKQLSMIFGDTDESYDKRFKTELGDWHKHFTVKDLDILGITMNTVEWFETEYTVYPRKKNIFRVFQDTPLEKVRVVILGQDPYYKPGQASGSFSIAGFCAEIAHGKTG